MGRNSMDLLVLQKEIMCIMHIKTQTHVKKVSSVIFYTLIKFLLKQRSMSGLDSIANLQIFE